MLLFGLAFLGIGIVSAFVAVPDELRKYQLLSTEAVSTTAHLVRVEDRGSASSGSRKKAKRVAIFEFSDSSGKRYSKEMNARNVVKLADQPMIYARSDPSVWHLGERASIAILALSVFGSATFGLIGLVISVLYFRKRQHRIQLAERGIQTTGRIVGVRRMARTKTHRNIGPVGVVTRRMTYCAIVQWQVPGEPQWRESMSGPIGYEEPSDAELRSIAPIIWYLPEDPSINMVDPNLYKHFSGAKSEIRIR